MARYQAKRLAKEGDAAFARACGEFARNDAFRSLNETIITNVGRDRDRGAMFARVPTGTESCAFCLMLASRGAVYHTRKTAGEWRHFHRGCDCKVVPSFEGDGTIKNLRVIHGDGAVDTLKKWMRASVLNQGARPYQYLTASGRGGTGRRASFRGWRAQARAGSNPAAPTIADLSHPYGWLFRISEARPDHRGAHRRAREGERRPQGGVRARGTGGLGREDGGSGVYLQYGYMKFP